MKKEIQNDLLSLIDNWQTLMPLKGKFLLESTEHLFRLNNYEILYLWGKLHRYSAEIKMPQIEEWAKEELKETIKDLIESIDSDQWRKGLEELKRYSDISDELYDYELSHQLAEELFFELDKAQLAVWSAKILAERFGLQERKLAELLEELYYNQCLIEANSELFAFLTPILVGERREFVEPPDAEFWKINGKFEYITEEHDIMAELV